jgi:hypothetical protein
VMEEYNVLDSPGVQQTKIIIIVVTIIFRRKPKEMKDLARIDESIPIVLSERMCRLEPRMASSSFYMCKPSSLPSKC